MKSLLIASSGCVALKGIDSLFVCVQVQGIVLKLPARRDLSSFLLVLFSRRERRTDLKAASDRTANAEMHGDIETLRRI